MTSSYYLFILTVVLYINYSWACVSYSLFQKFFLSTRKRLFPNFCVLYLYLFQNGFKLRFNSIENCGGPDQVVSIDQNFTTDLSSTCIVTTNGCVTSKGFTKAKANFSIMKNGVVMLTGNPDLCDALDKKSEEAKGKLAMFGFPTECPIPEGRRCMDGTKPVDVTKYKNFLNMAFGKMAIQADVEHDTVSCDEYYSISLINAMSESLFRFVFLFTGKILFQN